MNRLWALLVGAGVLAAGLLLHSSYQAGAAPRQDEAKPKPSLKRSVAASREDDEAIRKGVAAFSKAFNAGDLNGVMAGWAEDAEFIHESGKVYRGKPAIRAMLQKSLEGYKGHKQTIKIDNLRFVRPDIALEEGSVTMVSPENVTDTGKYSSVWVKADGKWLMERVRDLPGDAAEDEKPASFDKLKGLNWMLGEWGDKEGKGRVKLTCKWSEGQAFFLQDFVIKQADGKEFHVCQRVGWDPAMDQVRSWQFDSGGGFSIGWWTREGNSWVIQSEGLYPDGRQFTSTDTLKFVDDNNAVWTSKDREVDDQPLADMELSFTRMAKDR